MDKERKVEEFASRLGDLLQEITELTSMCDNSVARRVRNHLYKNTLPLAKEFDVELQQPLRYCDGPGGPGDRVLSTNEVLDEFQADDRRRSVFIDPEESAAVNLVDLFSGRLTTIEFRDPNDILDVSKIVTSALKIMREEYPVVTINYSLAKNKEEILYLLRSLVTEIENGEGLTLRENCSRNKELLGTRWTNNGRTLERGYVIKETCQIGRDRCCGNPKWETREIGAGWDVVWQDGNASTPPPMTPDPFQREPWNNRRPFFDDPSSGTLTSDWGWRGLQNGSDFHGGIDIAVPSGTVVQSVNSGEIVRIRNDGHNSGIVIQDGNTTYTYWHIIPDASLNEGDTVSVGMQLGTVAQGGAEHLHYAEHEPPNGNPDARNDSNSRNPIP